MIDIVVRAAARPLGRLRQPGVLARAVDRHVARARDEVPEGGERHVGDRLQDLLVLPARLARLLLQVALGRAVRLEDRLHEAQQNGLTLVVRVELARERDLVHPETGVAAGALKRRERVVASLVLGDRERDALLGRVCQRAVAQLGAEARVRAQHRRRPGKHADEVGELAAARERALENGDAALGGRQLVVDLEPALLRLHGASLSAYDLPGVSLREKGAIDTPMSAERGRGKAGYACAVPAATTIRKRPSRKAHRPSRSGWAIGLFMTDCARRRAGVGWPVMVTVRRSASGCSVSSSAARRSKRRGTSWVASSVGRSSATVPPSAPSSARSERLGRRSSASILRSHCRSTASRLMSSWSSSRKARAPAVCIGSLSFRLRG